MFTSTWTWIAKQLRQRHRWMCDQQLPDPYATARIDPEAIEAFWQRLEN